MAAAATSSSSYRRVPQNEPPQTQASNVSEASVDSSTTLQRSRGERLQDKFVAGTLVREMLPENCGFASMPSLSCSQRSVRIFSSPFSSSVVWMAAAYLVAKWTHFYSTLWTSDELNRILLKVSFVGLAIVITLLLYLMMYLPKVKGLTDPSAWNVYCPKVIPTMGITMLVTFLILIRRPPCPNGDR